MSPGFVACLFEPLGRRLDRAGRFVFTHECEVAAPPERVHALLVDLEGYPRWWPQVRAVASLGPDAAIVVCRSALPYDLDLVLEAVSREPGRLEVRIGGPIDGFARWTLAGSPVGTWMAYRQEVVARGRLRWAAFALRPLLRWNHHAMMRGFDRGLRAVLRR